MTYSLPRGTKDILQDEIGYWQHIETTAKGIFNLYNYNEIRTPIFEMTNLFERGIGSDTEIVEKEMYTFTDKGGRQLTLRPEGTASIARAFIQHNMHKTKKNLKAYYLGPMFRYERPQSGRYRQFHQIGVENIGNAHPYADAEMISMAFHLFDELGLSNLKVYINSIGCDICRPVIEERIKQFLSSNVKKLPKHLQDKVEKNPLRILDCKDKNVQTYISGMPDMREALSQKSKDHFNSVLEYLDQLHIPFEVKPTMVRGLDYYTETVFEIVSDDLDAQNTLCGGGRYNNLIKELGGGNIPSVGFAFGMERAVMILQKLSDIIPKSEKLIFIAPLGFPQQTRCFEIQDKLRRKGLKCEMDYSKEDLKGQLRQANKWKADIVLILGEDEAQKKTILVKDMNKRTQKEILQKDIIKVLSP